LVESFLAEIAVIHPGLVPLVRIAILMAVGLVCWLVISVPTLVLWLAGEGYFVAARRWLEDLAKLLWHVACRLWDGLPAPVARFIAAHRLRFVFDHNEAAIRHALGRVGQKAGAVTTSVAKLHEKLHGAVRKMTKQLVVIAALEIPDVRIEVPEAQEVVKQTSRRRRGVVNLVTGLVMGLILTRNST